MDGLEVSLAKMREAGVSDAAQRTFADYYRRLSDGDTGVLREAELESVGELPALGELPSVDDDEPEVLDRTVVIKLNGGLGTSMGLTKAKSLLEVKEGLTFLDIIARQVLSIRRQLGARLPLVLMNSFATHADTLEALERYPDLAVDVPLTFIQNRFPKLDADRLVPASLPENPALEWAPPGHGDLYTAIAGSGLLQTLLDRGYRHAFISNSDNLGATLEPRIVAWFASEGLPFLMEVTERTAADRKGGHLARRVGGGLVLRETAQTLDEDLEAFEDVSRHRFFNTNNLWLDLRALAEALEQRGGTLGLPMIVNHKTVDPSKPSTPRVIQLEAAMGAAVGAFDGAGALRVPRQRFAPVKTTDDLLVVRSDAYRLRNDAHVVPAREQTAVVRLDPRFYKLLPDFERRFPQGPPSLSECERLEVVGDVLFGRDVVVRGNVRIDQHDVQLKIEDGALLEG